MNIGFSNMSHAECRNEKNVVKDVEKDVVRNLQFFIQNYWPKGPIYPHIQEIS